MSEATPHIIAHRGASAAHPPGNTVEAFRAARTLGADWVELDVRLTADDHAAVHHDADLPDGRLIAEVSSGDLPGWVPLLDAALEACAGMGVNVEIKNDPSEPDFDDSDHLVDIVCGLLASRGDGQEVLLSSFRWASMARARSVLSEIPTALLGLDLDAPLIEAALEGGHVAVHPHHDFLTAENVHDATSRSLVVNTWTVDDAERFRALARFGVAGIVTNLPDRAVAALRS